MCVFSLDGVLTDLKRRRSALTASLKSEEVVRSQKTGEKRVLQLLAGPARVMTLAPPQPLCKASPKTPEWQSWPANWTGSTGLWRRRRKKS